MQKQLFLYFIGFLMVCSFISCEGNNENGTESEIVILGEKVTQNGFKYTQYIQNDGPKPQIGQYAYFNLETYGIAE